MIKVMMVMIMNEFIYVMKSFTPFEYDVKDADVIFLGIPFSSTSLSLPSIYGPTIVRESMKIIEGNENGINIYKKFKILDIGNIEIVPGSYDLTEKRIMQTIEDIKSINNHAILIFIGGEHLITLPIVKSLKPKTIIQIDAHSDIRDDYIGNKFSHTTWAKRALETGAKIIQCGIRSVSNEEDTSTVQIVNKEDFTDEFLKSLEQPIHLTIDVDALDMNYVVTGLPEPNGLKPKDLFEIISKVSKYVDTMDITEIADNKLPSNTGVIAANIIKKFLVSKC